MEYHTWNAGWPTRIAVLVTCAALFFVQGQIMAQRAIGKDQPHRILLNLTATPAKSIAVTWRTFESVRDAAVEVLEASDGPLAAEHATRFTAVATPWLHQEGPNATWYSAIVSGLRPSTVYAYRVGATGAWSEWNQFRTASAQPEPFTFLFFGDPQNDIREHVSRVFREAFRSVPEAKFWLFTGDLTTTPSDDLWNEWFEAAGFIHATLPSIMVPGNHDYGSIVLAAARLRTDPPRLWRTQFTLPENGIPGLEETSYVIDYQGARIVMLNSNARLLEQASWLDSVLTAGRGTWSIVAFHHPVYSSGGGRDNRRSREAFQPVFEKHHVDLVLQGHDHTYSRSHALANNGKVQSNGRGTVYVVSSSGPKMYKLNRQYAPIMATMAEGMQLYQVITVEPTTLQYRAVTPTGKIFDSFEVTK